MQVLGGYILSVTAAAILAAVATTIFDSKGASGTLVRMIAGLFLTYSVVQPLLHLDLGVLSGLTEALPAVGEAAAADGAQMADDAVRAIIKSQTEAYILDKAASFGAELTAEVTLSSTAPPVPAAVRIRGDVSPYAKARLQGILEDDLGIMRENQLWIG